MYQPPSRRPQVPYGAREDYDSYLLQRTLQEAIQPLADKIDRLQNSTYDKGVLDQRFAALERDISDIKASVSKNTDRQYGQTELLLSRVGALIGAIGGLVVILHYVHF